MSKMTYRYEPDYVISPGEILEETLMSRGLQKVEVAERCGLSAKQVSLILSGKAPVTPETAINLERILGVSANVWNNLEAKFRLSKARERDSSELSKHGEWLRSFPVKELIRKGIIEKSEDVATGVSHLLDFFGVGSVDAWSDHCKRLQVSFRRSPTFRSSFESLVTWLRLGELEAAEVDCATYDKSAFETALKKIRKLSCEVPAVFEPKMRELCASAGVAVVFVGELPGTHLSGATCWLSPNKAMMVLSLRYKTDDHLWFTLFHEAGHIKLHGKKGFFIDEDKQESFSEEELAADLFATNQLIPRKAYRKLVRMGKYDEENIIGFAKSINIAPGIVVGRLQHEEILSWRTPLNSLKRRFRLVETRSA